MRVMPGVQKVNFKILYNLNRASGTKQAIKEVVACSYLRFIITTEPEMAYKIFLTAIFMVLVSVAIARPRAAREDAKISAVPKDFIMADQLGGMIFYSAGNPPKA